MSNIKKGKCIVCDTGFHKEPLLVCNDMPASAQDIPDQNQKDFEHSIDLMLYQCKGCGLVQFNEEAVGYYRDVIRSGGYNSTMQELRKTQYKDFIERYDLRGKKIVEVGAGQGEFLLPLLNFDVKAFGIENKPELVKVAQDKGLNVSQGFVEDSDSVIPGGPYDAFVSFNYLEHQPNPNGYLQGIYTNTVDNAYGLLTVPSFEYILDKNNYYELIRDHIAYFTEETLRFCLEKNGFSTLSTQRVNNDTISIIVQKKQRLNTHNLESSQILFKENINGYINALISEGKKVAVWGASHQAFTILSTSGLSNKVSYIIDSAPFKQGRFAPASHIPIVSQDFYYNNPVDSIIIMAPGYINEISAIIRAKYSVDTKIAILEQNQVKEL